MAQDEVGTVVPFKDELCELLASGADSADGTKCTEPAIFRCHKCSKFFCLDHASEVDPQRFCVECIKPADVEIAELPLKDADGTTHAGRVLKPIGKAFANLGKLICEMTDDELKAFVVDYTARLREAELNKEFIKINLGLATYESIERKLAKQKPNGDVYFPIQSPYVVDGKKAKPAKARVLTEDKLAAAFAKAGITPEILAALIAKKKQKAG